MNKALCIIGLFGLIFFNMACHSDKVKKQTDQNYTIGMAKMEVKDYKGALQAFGKCVALNPNNYDAYHQRALAFKALNNKKNALYNYKMAQNILEKHEDLTEPGKHAEYQTLLQEINDYKTAPDVPVSTPSTGGSTTPITPTDTARF